MSGWIKVHRSITEHWLYTEKRVFSKFEAWNDILLTVNYSDAKCLIKGKLYIIKRGESVLSLDSWSRRWGWDKTRVRRFMEILKKDGMIEVKKDNITTHRTVCKYEDYQDLRNTSETQVKHKRNSNEIQMTPIKEEEEEEERKEGNIKFDFKKSLLELNIDTKLVDEWIKVRKAKRAVNTETAFNRFVIEVNKSSATHNEAVKMCVEKSWAGFEADWYEKNKPQVPKKEKLIIW